MNFLPENLNKFASQISVKSALNSMIWLSIPSVFLIGLGVYSQSTFLRVVLVSVGIMPWLAAVIGFFYFMLKNPAYLRSEEYQLMAQVLGDRDNPTPVIENVEKVKNLKSLVEGRDHE